LLDVRHSVKVPAERARAMVADDYTSAPGDWRQRAGNTLDCAASLHPCTGEVRNATHNPAAARRSGAISLSLDIEQNYLYELKVANTARITR
jgi:hypothetical protein